MASSNFFNWILIYQQRQIRTMACVDFTRTHIYCTLNTQFALLCEYTFKTFSFDLVKLVLQPDPELILSNAVYRLHEAGI